MSKMAREKIFQVILDPICVLTFSALALFSVNTALAETIPDALAKKLTEYQGLERGQIVLVEDESLARQFPGYSFYVLRFRRYPIARVPPEPLRPNNLFIVKADKSLDYIADTEMLKTFFHTVLAPVKTAAQARDAVKAWLQLAEELYQDGFFRFSISDDSLRTAALKDGGLEASGKALVNQQGGNMGEIGASLTFDAAGILIDVSESVQLHPGIRPKCQATKLLDPDPIVRSMAEESILVMGRAAKEYLNEQRAKASPELRHAIDKIWQRIVAEGR
jgi:hypothetical protein